MRKIELDLLTSVMLLVPLLAFAIADLRGSSKFGVYLAISLSFAVVVILYFRYGMLDEISAVAFFFITVLGLWTLKSRDTRFFKFQPTAVGFTAAGIVAYMQMIGPTVMERYGEVMADLWPKETAYMLQDPEFVAVLDRMALGAAPAFVLHGIWCGIAALRWSTEVWIVTRAIGFWILIFPCCYLIVRIFPP